MFPFNGPLYARFTQNYVKLHVHRNRGTINPSLWLGGDLRYYLLATRLRCSLRGLWMDCFLLPLHRGGRCISVITTHELRFRKETRIIACLSRRRGLRQHKSNMNIYSNTARCGTPANCSSYHLSNFYFTRLPLICLLWQYLVYCVYLRIVRLLSRLAGIVFIY